MHYSLTQGLKVAEILDVSRGSSYPAATADLQKGRLQTSFRVSDVHHCHLW